jgi:hypothetical protein
LDYLIATIILDGYIQKFGSDVEGSQVPGSTFKVGDKDRMDDPKTCRSRLSSLKQVPMDPWCSWGNAKNGVVIGQFASNVESGGRNETLNL